MARNMNNGRKQKGFAVICLGSASLFASAPAARAQTVVAPTVQPSAAQRAASSQGGARQYLAKPDAWYGTDEARAVAAIVLTHQSSLGGWPKNIDTTAAVNTLAPDKINGTFDNSATFDEIRLLTRIHNATKDAKYVPPIERGIDLILKSQYPTGGWPQSYPPGESYPRYITFNDGSMARLLSFLKEINETDAFAFLDTDRRAKIRTAFDRGIECILQCQIKVDGRLTAWCAQHDEKDFRPREGRTYELPSISGSESVGIVRLLMAIENPSPRIIASVDAAVAWFEAARLKGIRTDDVKDPAQPTGRDRVVVQDAAARPMWARFYQIGTNRPIFSDRNGVTKYTLAEIGHERRNGYRWLSYWPEDLLARDYPTWKAKHPTPTS